MKYSKLLISSIILSSGLYAVDAIQPADFNKYPLSKDLTAQSRGGDLPDKVAVTDGIGSLLVKPVGKNTDKLKNDAYNKIMYGNIKKLEDNETINNLITNGEITVDTDTLNKLKNNNFSSKYVEGDSCDDGKPNTSNDKIVNGVCKGILGYDNIYVQIAGSYNNDQNYVTITELELRDKNNNYITYDVSYPTLGSSTWIVTDSYGRIKPNYWGKSNLFDGDIEYIDNRSGYNSTTIFDIPKNSDISVINEFQLFTNNKFVTNVNIWVGSPEGRNMKKILFLDKNKNLIKSINISNWKTVRKINVNLIN